MRFVKCVTWEDVRRALRLRERNMEFELTDIFEEASKWGRELEEKLEENIEYVLKREGLLRGRVGSVVIPAGALYWECDDERCWYSANFEVFDKSGNVVLARGTVGGTMVELDENTFEISDMTVRMPVDDVARLLGMEKKAMYR
ncbi:MAG: hypothetical protein ACTSXC_07190 [Candidatus Freyarchaeota archaeon]